MQMCNLHLRITNSFARRTACASAVMLIGAFFAAEAIAQTSQIESTKIWNELKPEIFGNRTITSVDPSILKVIAPKRAQDAGLVPVDIEFKTTGQGKEIVAVTLVVDVNPSPLAATFKIGKGAGISKISTRLRINDYSFVRVIAETAKGELLMSETYVKATGGCSAPAVQNPEDAKATIGNMKLRQFPTEFDVFGAKRRELQLMIRHPNHSGFQMDQLTRYFIPPHFINKLSVSMDGQPILRMEGGISISEDPNFRFDYVVRPASTIEAEAVDTEGNIFRGNWPADALGL